MKSRMKKVIAIMCMAALIVTIVPSNIMTAKAASVKGTKIEVNQTYKDVLAEEDEVDWYTFEFTQKGYFTAEFGPMGDVGKLPYGWDFEIYDQNDKKLYSGCEILSKVTTGKYAFAPGTYYIRIDACNGSDEPTGYEYSLRVNTVEASTWECESNDMMSTADEIGTNGEINGSLYHGRDVDWYKFNVVENGYFTVGLDSGDFGKKMSFGWDLSIWNKEKDEIVYYENILFPTESVKLAFPTGTYYIKVKGFHSGEEAPIDYIYSLRLNNNYSSKWECEYNDSISTADTISPNMTYSGTLYHKDDEDYFKVEITEKGYFVVGVDSQDFGKTIEDGWNLAIYDKNGKTIEDYINIPSKFTSSKIAFGPGTYYISIEGYYHYSTTPINHVYNLKVKSVKSSVWECEANDSKTSADKITINSKSYYKGTSLNSGDKDVYRFVIPSKGDVKIKFKAQSISELISKDCGWCLYLYNSSGNKIYDLGEFTKLKSKTINLSKGVYYLQVVPDGYDNAPVDATYNFKVSHCKKPAKPTITKISSKKKTATIKWKKVANATGYKVFAKVGKKGTYKAVKTIKSNKTTFFTHKKLKKGKTYYYKVQAYTTKNGMTTKSAQSKYKAIVVR